MDDHSTKKAQIIQLNESAVRDHLGEMVRNTVEATHGYQDSKYDTAQTQTVSRTQTTSSTKFIDQQNSTIF